MADLKVTRTYNKLRFPPEIVQMVRDWAEGKGISVENASVVKVIGSMEQIDELDALIGKATAKREES